MSLVVHHVHSLHITNNNPSVIRAQVELESGTVLQLKPLIQPNTSQHFHLTTDDGIRNGEEFIVQVALDLPQPKDPPTVLAYENSALTHMRAMFTVEGTAAFPELKWCGTEPE